MVIKENFFDEIDNDVIVSSTEEPNYYRHHILILCHITEQSVFSKNVKALFRNMLSLMNNIFDDYLFSISERYNETGDVITRETFDDYYDNVLSDENYIKNIASKGKLILMNVFFNEELTFDNHIFLMNTLGLLAQNMFIKSQDDTWKAQQWVSPMRGVICDKSPLVNLYLPY